jgi:hypothetical protein
MFISAHALIACGPPEADDVTDVDGREPDAGTDATPDAPPVRLTMLAPPADVNAAGFGYAMAASGDTLVVTATSSFAPLNVGLAVVYVRRDGAWQEQARLTGAANAKTFGEGVAIDGDTIVVSEKVAGATDDDPVTRRAYVFTRTGEAWTQAQMLAPPEPSPGFAKSVAVQGDTIVVGDSGRYVLNQRVDMAVRVYVKDATTSMWIERAALLPPNGAQPSHDYARAVAIDNGRIAASDPYAQIGADVYGKVYVFARDAAGAWAYESDFNPQFVGAWPHSIGFGASLALDGDRMAVGIAGDACPYARVYERNGQTLQWNDVAKLDPQHNACSGLTANVAMSGDSIAIGATGKGSEEPLFRIDGAGYVFAKGAAGWPASPESVRPTNATSAGSAIVLRDDEMLVGAPGQSLVYAYKR